MAQFRILVVDSHKIVRQGLGALLQQRPDFEVVGDSDAASALARAIELKPHVILVEPRIPSLDDGMRLLSQLHEAVVDSHILVLTAAGDDSDIVYRAIHNGAIGCVLKSSSDIDEIEEAIRRVGNGHAFLSAAALNNLVESVANGNPPPQPSKPDQLDGLSPREFDVLDLVAQGHSNREIAERLVISESTVRSHLQHILDKLQLTNRVQAAAYALRTRRTPQSKKVAQTVTSTREWP